MKRFVSALMMIVCIFCMTACGGNVKEAQIPEYSSEVYTGKEIQDAIDVTMDYFKKKFSGCTLTEITYYGDDKLPDYQEFAQRNNADEVIVLVSSFDVGPSGGDGSLNPNDTYRNWKWILVRSDGGEWVHVDHGY